MTTSQTIEQSQATVSKQANTRNQAAHKKIQKTTKLKWRDIWQSTLCWKITIGLFLSIMVIQFAVLSMTLTEYRDSSQHALRQAAKSAVTPLLNLTFGEQTIVRIAANSILANTNVRGIRIEGAGGETVVKFGETLQNQNLRAFPHNWYSSDRTRAEFTFAPHVLNSPYYAVVRMDSTQEGERLDQFMTSTIALVMLISGGITIVIMTLLGQWLLGPILILRDNLSAAAKNPESPEEYITTTTRDDELGRVIKAANQLLKQSGQNLDSVKNRAADKIHRLAYYDPLTDLPNRTFFVEELGEQITKVKQESGYHLAVIIADIDHFKDINDTLGHVIGDDLLRSIGKRMASELPDVQMVARLNADEFALIVKLPQTRTAAKQYLRLMFNSFDKPFEISENNLQPNISIGISIYPDDGVEAIDLLKKSQLALGHAKHEGRNTARFYSEDFDKAVWERVQIVRDLRGALERDELFMVFHPQFDLETGQIIGAETLLRWKKANGDFVSPAIFIPAAEQSGLITQIGEWVLRQACLKAKQWQDQGIPPFRIAVNVSAIQFRQTGFVSTVDKIIKETGLDPKWLELEVTESAVMDNVDVTIRMLNELKELGIELAIDDFGTGYASLSYLKKFPIHRLKIDQSFIRDLDKDRYDAAIAKTVITLGHALGLSVIAEGVENVQHISFLKQQGCDEAQGFHYTKPLPEDELLTFIKDYTQQLRDLGQLANI